MHWGTGSISLEPDGRYEISVSLGLDADGKRRRVKQRVRGTKREALAALDKLRQTYGLTSGDGSAASQRLDAYLSSWLAVRTDLEPKSLRSYATGVANLSAVVGHIRLDRLTPERIAGGLKAMRTSGKGDRTVQAAYETLRAALNWAVKQQRILPANPIASVPRPRFNREIDFLSKDEALAFLAAVPDDRYRALWHVEIALGLRWGEATGLQWRDVDLESATLTIARAMKETRTLGTTKSKRSRRRLDLPASIVAELRRHRKRYGGAARPQDLVFATETGTALHASNVERRFFEPALVKAGILEPRRVPKKGEKLEPRTGRRIRFHDLRHTAAALRLLAGEHPKVIQELLGHASIRTTLDVYGHLVPTMGRDAARRYDEMMTG